MLPRACWSKDLPTCTTFHNDPGYLMLDGGLLPFLRHNGPALQVDEVRKHGFRVGFPVRVLA